MITNSFVWFKIGQTKREDIVFHSAEYKNPCVFLYIFFLYYSNNAFYKYRLNCYTDEEKWRQTRPVSPAAVSIGIVLQTLQTLQPSRAGLAIWAGLGWILVCWCSLTSLAPVSFSCSSASRLPRSCVFSTHRLPPFQHALSLLLPCALGLFRGPSGPRELGWRSGLGWSGFAGVPSHLSRILLSVSLFPHFTCTFFCSEGAGVPGLITMSGGVVLQCTGVTSLKQSVSTASKFTPCNK